jgi:hypothetical protein
MGGWPPMPVWGRPGRRLGRCGSRDRPLHLGLRPAEGRVPRLGEQGRGGDRPALSSRGRLEHRQALPRRTCRRGAAGRPTAWVTEAAESPAALARWDVDLVIKPVVSAGVRDTARFPMAERAAAAAFTEGILVGGRPVMAQPYLERLDAAGETGLVYLGGAYSHAFGEAAVLAGLALGVGCSRRRRSRPGRRPPADWPEPGQATGAGTAARRRSRTRRTTAKAMSHTLHST